MDKLSKIEELINEEMKDINTLMPKHLKKVLNGCDLDDEFILEAEAMLAVFDRLVSDIKGIIEEPKDKIILSTYARINEMAVLRESLPPEHPESIESQFKKIKYKK